MLSRVKVPEAVAITCHLSLSSFRNSYSARCGAVQKLVLLCLQRRLTAYPLHRYNDMDMWAFLRYRNASSRALPSIAKHRRQCSVLLSIIEMLDSEVMRTYEQQVHGILKCNYGNPIIDR